MKDKKFHDILDIILFYWQFAKSRFSYIRHVTNFFLSRCASSKNEAEHVLREGGTIADVPSVESPVNRRRKRK